ncbi:MAG: AlkA N-terminal domain-containing protein [Gemmatimonadaceae bacterium]
MVLQRTAYYQALTARDERFDGVFFVGVTSTRIYCRPVCRARTPRLANCKFFSSPAAAERLGFRPCLRCRPELAPGNAPVDATATLAELASRSIAAGALNGGSLETLAESLGVTARHLRRAVVQHLGVSPIDLATTHRLLLAKRLLHETSLPITQVAFASGFESLRRFNDAFKGRYRLAPASLRREMLTTGESATGTTAEADGVELSLEFRRPLDWDALLGFLRDRATPGVEWVGDRQYARTMRVHQHTGRVDVEMRDEGRRPALVARISPSLVPVLMPMLAHLRDLFDLDANPDAIADHLVRSGITTDRDAVHATRVPGCVDGFELAVRAILGQQVSVKGATTLMGRFVRAFGQPFTDTAPRTGPALELVMPDAERIARLGVGDIAALGMPTSRAQAILALARAVADRTLSLEAGGDVARSVRALNALPGVGDWTAQYVAMRALRWPDAFPAGDLALRKAAGNITASQLASRSEAWRPWRAYAAMYLWRSLSASPATGATARSLP